MPPRASYHNQYCRFGCDQLETAHHVFVHCPQFRDLRDTAVAHLISETSELLAAAETPAPTQVALVQIASSLFADNEMWPLRSSRYYLGLTPIIPAHLVAPRLLQRVAHAWHLCAIRLAGRIWGDLKRRSKPPFTLVFPPPPTIDPLPAAVLHLPLHMLSEHVLFVHHLYLFTLVDEALVPELL